MTHFSIRHKEVMVHKLALTLLLLAVAHTSALAGRPGSVALENSTKQAAKRLSAPNSRRAARRTGQTAAAETPKSTRAAKAVPAAHVGAPKPVGKTGNTVAKAGARQEVARPAQHASVGVGSRARGPMSEPFPSNLQLPIVHGDVRRGQEHYDPTGSNGPLLDTSEKNRWKLLSENFRVGELSMSGGNYSDKSRITRDLVVCLQSIRNSVGQPVWVRSGYRSYKRNVEVYKQRGKKPTDSQHIAGKAADIRVEGMPGLALAKVAIDSCGPNVAVGVGLDYAHVDVRGTFRSWSYDNVPKSQLAEIRRYHDANLLASRTRDKKPRKTLTAKHTSGGSPSSEGGSDTTSRAGRDTRR